MTFFGKKHVAAIGTGFIEPVAACSAGSYAFRIASVGAGVYQLQGNNNCPALDVFWGNVCTGNLSAAGYCADGSDHEYQVTSVGVISHQSSYGPYIYPWAW